MRKKVKPMVVSSYKINKDIRTEIEKRYNILTAIVMIFILILIIGLFFVQIVQNEHYKSEMESLTKKIVYGDSAPRGRIYDRNGKLIVDNKPLKVIYYKKPSKVTTKEEIETAYKLAEMIDLDYSKLKVGANLFKIINKEIYKGSYSSYNNNVIKYNNVW